LWDLGTGKKALQVPDRDREVSAVGLSPDGRFLLMGTDRGAICIWDLLVDREVGRFEGHRGGVCALSCSVHGHLASGSDDSTVLIWDLDRAVAKCRRRAGLKQADMVALWAALADADALKGNRAVWQLALAPAKSVSWVKKHLRPVRPDRRVERLVRDLGSADYEDRERAMKQLAELGEKAEYALRAALLGATDLEVRRRAGRLLKAIQGRPLPALQRRSLALLEQIGSAEAREHLRQLAKGAPGARLTLEAQAALERLAGRGRPKAAP